MTIRATRLRPIGGTAAGGPVPVRGAAPIELRRLVLCFLSVDLAESTETLARLAERRSTAARTYRSIVRTAVATHGGREITTQGDRIVAGFPTPTDAVECAVAIHSASAWHNRGAADRVDVRIGIQLGEADGALMSRRPGSLPCPAVEAGRLRDAASAGQILVSDLVSSLASPRGVAFERTGLLGLGNAAAPVPTFEARLTDPRAALIPLPAHLLDHLRRTPFVGRRAERERLHADWLSAAAGERRLSVVTGEPGAGKSRLAMELAHDVHAEGGLVLWGRSFEEAVLPFQPFVEALRQYFTGTDPQEMAWLSGAVRRQLARLVPEACLRGGAGMKHVSGDDDRHRLFEAVEAFLSGASLSAPVLLILDDLQWADAASLLLLKTLMLDRRAASLMLLVIYRNTDVGPSHDVARVLADIERERPIDHVSLGGLDLADIAELVEVGIRSPIPRGLFRTIWDDTAGNPYFAEELIEHVEALRTAGNQPTGDAPRTVIAELGVPRRVRDRVGRRLQRLSTPACEALASAAVVGPRFRLDVLSEVLSMSESRLVALMDEAVSAGLLVEIDHTGRYGFRHPIVRRALYDHHTANRRSLIRARAASALDRRRRDRRTGAARLACRCPKPTIAALTGGPADVWPTSAEAVVAAR